MIVLRILIIFVLLLAGIYFIKPQLFQSVKNHLFPSTTINIQDYIITPDPSELFLVWLKVSTLKDYWFNWISSSTDLYFQAINLFKVNIIQLLENSKDKKITLQTYITQLEHTLDQIENSISSLTAFYTQEEDLANTYLQQKKVWDSMFNQWFIEEDSQLIQDWVKTAYRNWPKYIKHRILANASKIIVSKLTQIKQLLTLKLQLLQSNQEDIINNFDLIKWNLLPKLLELKRRLENNFYY